MLAYSRRRCIATLILNLSTTPSCVAALSIGCLMTSDKNCTKMATCKCQNTSQWYTECNNRRTAVWTVLFIDSTLLYSTMEMYQLKSDTGFKHLSDQEVYSLAMMAVCGQFNDAGYPSPHLSFKQLFSLPSPFLATVTCSTISGTSGVSAAPVSNNMLLDCDN